MIDPDTSTQKKRERFPAMQCYVDRVYNCFDSSSKDKEPAKKKATINTYLPEEKTVIGKAIGSTQHDLNDDMEECVDSSKTSPGEFE